MANEANSCAPDFWQWACLHFDRWTISVDKIVSEIARRTCFSACVYSFWREKQAYGGASFPCGQALQTCVLRFWCKLKFVYWLSLKTGIWKQLLLQQLMYRRKGSQITTGGGQTMETTKCVDVVIWLPRLVYSSHYAWPTYLKHFNACLWTTDDLTTVWREKVQPVMRHAHLFREVAHCLLPGSRRQKQVPVRTRLAAFS